MVGNNGACDLYYMKFLNIRQILCKIACMWGLKTWICLTRKCAQIWAKDKDMHSFGTIPHYITEIILKKPHTPI